MRGRAFFSTARGAAGRTRERMGASAGGAGGAAAPRPWIETAEGGGSWLRVRVQPRAPRAGIAGLRGEALLLRVSAPPVEGEANRAACELVARALGLPRRAVTVAAGASGRSKLLHVAGRPPAAVRARLAELGVAIH